MSRSGGPRMSPNTKRARYPYTRMRVYTSVVTFVLSIILVVLLLWNDLLHFAYYFISTLAVSSVVFLLEARFLSVAASRLSGESVSQAEKGASQWKRLLLLLAILLSSLIVPLLLAQFLTPEVWFVLLISFTSGASIAEIVFYVHTR